jgi:sugar/nucleoside kinase (ribokinase family)
VSKPIQVVGIGNALVDVISPTDDAFLAAHGVQKGIMQLIDLDRAAELYAAMGPAPAISGGSVGNTIGGLSGLGTRTGFVGKVRNDQFGEVFAHDMRAFGASFDTPMAPAGHPLATGRSFILYTPDGERSMNTYLGVAETLAPADIDVWLMGATEWLLLEGYLFDRPESQAAFAKAARAAKAAGGRVGITLSDPFCVERHREAFLALIRSDMDLVVANEHELMALYLTGDLDTAMARAEADVAITVCTRGAGGAHVLADAGRVHAPAVATRVVDVTGAGDLFAAGFLHGLTAGCDWLTCARMGNIAAGEVISHVGARPEADLRALFAAEGLG